MNRRTCRLGAPERAPSAAAVWSKVAADPHPAAIPLDTLGEIPAFPINESDQTTTEVERMDTGPDPAPLDFRSCRLAGVRSGRIWPPVAGTFARIIDGHHCTAATQASHAAPGRR